jgi:hypothetical protein
MTDFDKNVFINCPFDKEYYELLRPLLFTLIFHGFYPRIALESSDSGMLRIDKIRLLIQSSRYSIHDLSRLQATRKNEIARLNMPFELGIDFGCRSFAGPGSPYRQKRFLILEKEKFRYMKALSDINGFDIKYHSNQPQEMIAAIRNWFVETVGLKNLLSPNVIWYKFTDFYGDLYDSMISEGFTKDQINFMPMPELIEYIKLWCAKNASQ